MLSLKSRRALLILASALALTGCGNGGGEPKAKAKQFIVTSAVDCADNAGLSYEACTEIIASAVAVHNKSAAKYRSLKACETTEGEGKCERMDETEYRPRLTAFHMTLSEKPSAVPLYPVQDTTAGFRNAGNTVLSLDDENLNFTKSATHASELYMDGKKQRKKVM